MLAGISDILYDKTGITKKSPATHNAGNIFGIMKPRNFW